MVDDSVVGKVFSKQGAMTTDASWLQFLPRFIRTRLEGHTNLLKVLGNVGWLSGEKVLNLFVGLFVGVWVARYLGPEQFGLLSYLTAFVMLFNPLAELGLGDIVVRNLAEDSSHRDSILGTAFLLLFLSGILAMVLCIGVALFLPDTQNLWLLLILSSALVLQSFNTIDFWFRSQVLAKPVAFMRSICIILVAAMNIGIIITHAPLSAFVWIRSLNLMLVAIGLYVVYQNIEKTIAKWHFDLNQARILLRDSWPFILSGFAGVIYLRIDQVMLTNMVGEQENGMYATAVRLVELWYFIPMAIYASVLPTIIEARKVSEVVFYARLQKLYNAMSFLSYMIAIPMTLLAPWVITILFGKDYNGAVPIVIIMVWSLLFTNLGVARSAFLVSENLIKTHTFTVVLGAITNVFLNIWLLPRYGGVGAAIASLVAYWLASHGSCFLYKPLFKTGNMLTKAMIYPKIW